MTSPDDPDRDQRLIYHSAASGRSRPRLHASATWTRAAKREYSRLAVELSSAKINTVAKRAARSCLEYLHQHTTALEPFASSRFTLDISFVADDEMAALNTTYRGKNKPTDVLSFAQSEGETFVTDSEEMLLGDIVIAVGTASRQALDLGHDLQHEIAFLAVHGTLHLCGFDHDTASRRRVMWGLQDKIVEAVRGSSTSISSPCS